MHIYSHAQISIEKTPTLSLLVVLVRVPQGAADDIRSVLQSSGLWHQ